MHAPSAPLKEYRQQPTSFLTVRLEKSEWSFLQQDVVLVVAFLEGARRRSPEKESGNISAERSVLTMPGAIIGIYGKQRSGKTLIAYKLVKGLQERCREHGIELPVYTNLYTPRDKGFTYVNSLEALPLDLKPKIVLIDEIYNGCDAQDYRKLKDISIFINTLGKQNCLFVFTSIDAQMVYNRIRNQMNVVILVKSAQQHIHYKFVYLNTGKTVDFIAEKNAALFEGVWYDTNFIPLDFDWEMKSWRKKLEQFYRVNYNMELTL